MLDITRNTIPESVKTVHLIAACGTGMGALACALVQQGYRVTGSDRHVYPPMSTFLSEKGIDLFQGFDGRHLSYGPDLVVVGNAVVRDNPEAKVLAKMGLAFCSMPQAVNHFMAAGKQIVVVAGTHGKTTTASILAWLFYRAGWDPSFMIGGIVNDFNSNYRIGQGPVMVIEGDEYDTAFFNKVPKFTHYVPHKAILTGIEYDHADIYPDIEAVMAAFAGFISAIPAQSLLFAFDADANVAGGLALCRGRVSTYGSQPESTWRIANAVSRGRYLEFDVIKTGALYHHFRSPLAGTHNAHNALAAIAVADSAGISARVMAEALIAFKGIKRRQEVRGVRRGVTVIDDFAHHPTAVRETLAAVRRHYAGARLIAVFEPRTHTSMRAVFQEVYATVFDAADLICIRQPPLLGKVPPGERFCSRQLVGDLKARGRDARYFQDTDEILEFLAAQARCGDVILVMSNGGFDNIHQRVLQRLTDN